MRYFKEAALKDDWKQFKYLVKHKYYLMKPARQVGIPLHTALLHDWSKFTPKEWASYREYWLGPQGMRGAKDPEVKERFREAWKHHKAYSPHHFRLSGIEKWDKLKYRLERIIDWYAAAKASSKYPELFPDFKTWYIEVLPKRQVSGRFKVEPETNKYIRERLAVI